MEGFQEAEESSLNSRHDSQGDKVIHMMRHGQTEMNVFLQFNEQARQGLLDPKLYDTKLTYHGRRQAGAATAQVAKLDPYPQLLVVSPLSRALSTAEAAFKGVDCPRMVQPLARERLYYSSDVGQLPAQLQRQWPMYDFSDLEPIWWYSDGSNDPTVAIPEPNEEFLFRVYDLYRWLLSLPQTSVALVSHHGVLKALTGIDFDNCQMISMNLSDFPIEGYMQQLRNSLRASPTPDPSAFRPNSSQIADDYYDDEPATLGDHLGAGPTMASSHVYSDPQLLYPGTHHPYEYESHWMHSGRVTPVADSAYIPQPRFYSQGSAFRGMSRAPTPPQTPFPYGYHAGMTSDPLAGRGHMGYYEAPYAGQYAGGLALRAHTGGVLFNNRQSSVMSRQSSTTSFLGGI